MDFARGEVTAILQHKSWNANNKDLARPVLLTKVVWEKDGKMQFVKLPVLLSDPTLIKMATGYMEGDILSIHGDLREDKQLGIYLEAKSVCRARPIEGDKKALLQGEIALLGLPQRKNQILVEGEFLGRFVTSRRESLSKGDLKKEDSFPIAFEGKPFSGSGMGIGSLKEEDNRTVLYLEHRMKGESYGKQSKGNAGGDSAGN